MCKLFSSYMPCVSLLSGYGHEPEYIFVPKKLPAVLSFLTVPPPKLTSSLRPQDCNVAERLFRSIFGVTAPYCTAHHGLLRARRPQSQSKQEELPPPSLSGGISLPFQYRFQCYLIPGDSQNSLENNCGSTP